MSRPTRTLCFLYAILAVAALVVTWSWNFAFFAGPDASLGSFLAGAYANPAAASLSSDLLFLTLVAVVWMVVEARRHGIRFVWLYVAMGFAVAISVSFPLFLIARERRLAGA
jgi:hypothetical protein